jgi:glutamate dehydrogenase (NAD(P)+)
MRYDGFLMYDMITGCGCAAALDEAWKLKGGNPRARVVIQGFGCVGASLAHCVSKMGYSVVAIADANGMVCSEDGLDAERLVETRRPNGELNREAFAEGYEWRSNSEWLDVDCDILVPAALEDVINRDNADKVKASLIVEAANMPVTAEADEILTKNGVDICVDFVANLGGVRLYEVVVFGLVKPEPKAIVNDTMELVRRQIRKVSETARTRGVTARAAAKELFAPDTFDTPDI